MRYPSGAVGCVSRNYDDGKWRIVCGDHDTTYPSRDAAARAEYKLAQRETTANEDKAHADCALGIHSWSDAIGKLPPDTKCTHCGELYGNPD